MPACTIPSAGFTFSTSPTSNQKPVTMTVVDTTTSPNCAITSWFWDWNDGSTSMLQNPGSHTYLAEGTYEITLKVTNAAGSNTTGSVQVKVKK
jgi:PKD repeat protein